MGRSALVGERREEILAAAIRVLAQDGIAETTTRKIASEAKVNQASLRYYFGSKDDLLFAVLQEMMRVTRDLVRASMPAGRNVPEIIAHSCQAVWSRIESAPELQVMQYELTLYALRNPASAWLAQQQYEGSCAVVAELLQQGFTAANQTCTVPLTDLAHFIVGGFDGLTLQFISDRDPARARRGLDLLIKAVISLAGESPAMAG